MATTRRRSDDPAFDRLSGDVERIRGAHEHVIDRLDELVAEVKAFHTEVAQVRREFQLAEATRNEAFSKAVEKVLHAPAQKVVQIEPFSRKVGWGLLTAAFILVAVQLIDLARTAS